MMFGNNRDDKLVELGFGDSLGDATLAAQENLTGQQKAEVDGYRQLKSDLNLLREVPEMQMSTERLRDAILKTGLKTEVQKTPTFLSWAWMPAGAAALAFAWVMLPRIGSLGSPGANSVEPRIVMNERDFMMPKSDGTSVLSNPSVTIESNLLKPNAAPPRAVATMIGPAEKSPVIVASRESSEQNKKPNRKRVRNRISTLVASNVAIGSGIDGALSGQFKENSKGSSAKSRSAEPMTVQPTVSKIVAFADQALTKGKDSIVLIDAPAAQGTDTTAIEVESATNVVVGG